jgi:hypothetical protein
MVMYSHSDIRCTLGWEKAILRATSINASKVSMGVRAAV